LHIGLYHQPLVAGRDTSVRAFGAVAHIVGLYSETEGESGMSKTDFLCLGVGVFLQGYAILPYEWVNPWSALLGMG